MSGQGGEVRRLDRAPGERYRQDGAGGPSGGSPPGPSLRRRLAAAAGVALGTAVVTFAVTTVDIGPGLLVIGLASGWLTGIAVAGGAPAGRGAGAGLRRALAAAGVAALGLVLGLLADSLRAYAIGGVLLPWEYALTLFGWVAPASIVLAALAGAVRGR